MKFDWNAPPPSGDRFDREPLLPILTGDEVIEYLNAHIQRGACPMCQGKVFTAMAVGADHNTYPAFPIYRLLPGNETERVMKAVPLVLAACRGCGWIASFLRTAVEAWAEARRVLPSIPEVA